MSTELALHPVHLTPDKEGRMPPSALVPFCSYQRDSHLLGQERPELDNMTLCNKFKLTILEGQVCHSLDITKYMRKPTKVGKMNGLFLLLDPNPYQVNSSTRNVEAQRNEQDSFKVYIHTLAQHTTYGPGAYAMHTLKSMTGTKSFEELPDNQKECRVHNREECQTNKFLNKVKSNCTCVPWPLANDRSNTEVIICVQYILLLLYMRRSSVDQRVSLVLQK